MKEKDRVFLLDAPIAPSGLFGDAVDSVVSRYQEACKQAAGHKPAVYQLLLPRPETETSGTLGRGLPRIGPTCGSCFSRRSLRPNGPDAISGMLRAAPTREERVAPHYTVSVSPRCPQEASLLPLPGLQGAMVSSEPADVADTGCSSPLLGSLEHYSSTPPPFDGVLPTLVGPEQTLVIEQEVETHLRKEAIEVVPTQHRESGFYSRYFIVPKKSEDCFLTIDLKDAYFHVSILPQHRKFLRFAFRGEAYQYRVLPFGPALSPCTFTKCMDVALAPLRLQGIRILNSQLHRLLFDLSSVRADGGSTSRCCFCLHERAEVEKSVLSPLQTLTYLGVVWDLTTMQARLSPARIEFILCLLLGSSCESERRLVTHCKAVPTTAGSDGSSVQHDTFWPAAHEAPAVVAQNQGVLPDGKPTSHDQFHRAVTTCLRHVEETLVSKSRFGVGRSLLPCHASDRCIPHRLGGGHEWSPCPGSVVRSPSQLASSTVWKCWPCFEL
ncbi:Gag-Pol polyprotein [Labeo rohita]|uniref:ribonuclease H n=1 Tax=Labeo rohita TaxID=84645 RepID=A0ABQ8L5N9_LABRO|nr:Gag-Pol polyprotein [Labeo rohita]